MAFCRSILTWLRHLSVVSCQSFHSKSTGLAPKFFFSDLTVPLYILPLCSYHSVSLFLHLRRLSNMTAICPSFQNMQELTYQANELPFVHKDHNVKHNLKPLLSLWFFPYFSNTVFITFDIYG